MGRRFAWFGVGDVAFVAVAAGAAMAYAAGPLATLRQAVTPVHQTIPPTLPVVTATPVETTTVDLAKPDDFAEPSELPADFGLPVEFRLPDVRLPGIEQPKVVATETVPLPTVLLPAIPQPTVPQLTEPHGPSLLPSAVPETVSPAAVPTEFAQPATATLASEPSESAIVAIGASDPQAPATAADAKVEPVPTIAPVEAPAKIERLPAAVAGEGTEFSEDPTFRKPLSAIRIDLAPSAGQLPPNAAASHYAGSAENVVPRAGQETIFFWQASNLCHRPLYFNQDYVERDGRSFGPLQPAVSGAQFFGSIPLLPYRMVKQPPCRCIYTLGESRPDGYGRRWGAR